MRSRRTGARTRALSMVLALTFAAHGPSAASNEAKASTGPSPDTAQSLEVQRGKALFTQLSCGDCHTLRDAGAAGRAAPSLDGNPNITPSHVITKLASGGDDKMPAFSDQLTPREIEEIAAYVTYAAGN